MPDFRAFCLPPAAGAAEITLSPEESHHLVVVNRARRNAPVIAFDGAGTEWICELTGDRKNAAVLTVGSTRRVPPLPYEITLAQALPKGGAMDAIVRKATEIGAKRIIPLETERTQVHLDRDRSDRKTEKWEHAALEAAKQCGNPFVPAVLPVQTIASLLATVDDYDLRLIASLQSDAQSLRSALAGFRASHAREPRKIIWLIGPEGDFSPAEFAAAAHASFTGITLGPLVLRCETAATYALSILSYELQNPA